MISKEHLQKFRDLYRKTFGKEIPEQEALGKAIQLLRLVEIIYKPMTKEDMARLEKRRRETGFYESPSKG